MIPLTIQDQIEYGKSLDYSHRNFIGDADLIYLQTNDEIKIPMNPLINKYKEYFDKYIVEEEITDIQEAEYRFSPKKLSYDLYGSTEYWSILLYINEAHSILDFEPKDTVRYIDLQVLQELLNEIMILEDIIE